MYIADQFQQVTVGIDQQSLVSALKKVAGSFLPAVQIVCVTEPDILHYPGQRHLTDLDRQMNMLCEVPDYVKFSPPSTVHPFHSCFESMIHFT